MQTAYRPHALWSITGKLSPLDSRTPLASLGINAVNLAQGSLICRPPAVKDALFKAICDDRAQSTTRYGWVAKPGLRVTFAANTRRDIHSLEIDPT